MTVSPGLWLVELIRAPARTALRVLTLAAAVALLAAMLLFVGHSLNTMTGGAVRSVPLDWQGPVGSYDAAVKVATRVARQPGVAEAVPVATAPFAGVEHVSPAAGTIRSGAGSILAVPPGYLGHLTTFRFLRGSLRPGEVVFDQQLAATLQVQPGDAVSMTPRRGAPPVRLRVSGIALVTASDQLFQPLNPLLGPAPAQPPANIAILPLATFAAKIAPALPSITSAAGASAVPGSQTGTQWQVQAQVDPAALTGSPSHALTQATQLRNRVERSLPGQIVFVDNLADSLNTAAGDALYAETLYIMLAVPGRAHCARTRVSRRARNGGERPAESCSASRPRRSPPRPACSCGAREPRPRTRRRGDRHRDRARRRPAVRLQSWDRRRTRPLDLRRLCRARRRRRRGQSHRSGGRRLSPERHGRPPQRPAHRPAALAAALPRPARARRFRARLLADDPHRVLGGRQPRLEPDALAVGLHVPGAGAALDRRRRCCSCGCAAG